jgi:hypothetical protein
MASQTLAEAKKLINNDLVTGVVEDIISVNPIFDYLPFNGYEGQGFIVNRENALGTAGMYGVGDTITHKTAATFTTYTFTATKLIGDAELDGLVIASSQGAGVDQVAIEVSSKAKSIGRLFQTGMATGDAAGANMNSFHTLCDASQFTTASAGQALSFALLDELMDLVLAKDGQVDFITMSKKTLRSYKVLVRAMGGNDLDMIVNDKTGRPVIGYNGVPIFRNDYITNTETANGAALTTGALTSVYAGCFDDGSNKLGIAGIHPISVPAGVVVEPVGAMESADTMIYRVKQYANLASFNRRGLARLTSINN